MAKARVIVVIEKFPGPADGFVRLRVVGTDSEDEEDELNVRHRSSSGRRSTSPKCPNNYSLSRSSIDAKYRMWARRSERRPEALMQRQGLPYRF